MASFPPPAPPMQPLAAPSVAAAPSSDLTLSPSLLIISGILLFVALASLSINLFLRLLSRRRQQPRAGPLHHRSPSSSSSDSYLAAPPAAAAAAVTETVTVTTAAAGMSDDEKAALVESLPLFTLASSLATLPKSSPDCAVCLSPFDPAAELRLLPACRHAFHAACVDAWLKSTPSCPLCRASISLPHPSLPTDGAGAGAGGGSESFRVEIGSVSQRPPGSENSGGDGSRRSYSLGSFEYVVDDEIDAVVSRIATRRNKEETKPSASPTLASELASAVGSGGGRGWLKDYVDRLASSASSSFNSLRFSGRWSCSGGASRRWEQEVAAAAEEAGIAGFYRWLVEV